MHPERIQVIINPAAGQGQPVLNALNTSLQDAGVDWGVSITREAGDGRRLARDAVAAGVDVVAVYGGDGTVSEVASGLIGTEIPLAILPGGTANVLAVDLGIPNNLREACALIYDNNSIVRAIDVGQVDERHFLLRAGVGFEAAMVEGADRNLKDRLGSLAYVLSAFQALRKSKIARYHLTLDGRELVSDGMTCIIANSGKLGVPDLSLAPTIAVDDGLLDVVVVRRADLNSLLSAAASVVEGSEPGEPLQHWQVGEVTIATNPPQTVQADGEILGHTPISARIIPHAVHVLTPRATD